MKEAELSSTLEGIADQIIFYDGFAQLQQLLITKTSQAPKLLMYVSQFNSTHKKWGHPTATDFFV